MTNWTAMSESHELNIPEFHFANGEYRPTKLYCRTLGSLNGSRNNAVLLLHGTSGSSLQFLTPETADVLFGSDQPLDLTKYFVIMPDAIGHGRSSKPSDAPENGFPSYSYKDIVAGQNAIVTNLFAIERLRLVLGTSMGGMQTWMWGIAYPKMMDALMPIACLPESLRGYNLLYRRLMLAIIRAGSTQAGGRSLTSAEAVGLAWNIFQLVIAGKSDLAREYQDADTADQYIREISNQAEASQQPLDVIWEFNASRDYDPNSTIGQIESHLLTLNFSDDQINSSGLSKLDIDIRRVSRGHAVTIDLGETGHGHQSFVNSHVWTDYLRELLAVSASK